jgi:hypothetical protein
VFTGEGSEGVGVGVGLGDAVNRGLSSAFPFSFLPHPDKTKQRTRQIIPATTNTLLVPFIIPPPVQLLIQNHLITEQAVLPERISAFSLIFR